MLRSSYVLSGGKHVLIGGRFRVINVGCPGYHVGGHLGVLEHPEAPKITP